MSDTKNDGKGAQPGTGQAGGPSAGGIKKPAPIIDLKATVVEPPKAPGAATPDATKPEPAKAVAAAASAAAATVAAKASAADKDTGKDAGAKPASASAGGATAATGKATGADASARATAPARAGGGSGFFTHMAAGLAGAIVAIGASQFLDLGLGGGNNNLSPELTRRLAALEQSAKPTGAPADAQKIAAVEARLARLEEAAQALANGQVKIATDAKLAEEKLAALPAGMGDAAARVAKLEEQLTAMATAAAADPRGGTRLQQLAELTSKVRDVETLLATRTAQTRTEMIQQMDQRLAKAVEQAESARSLLAQRTQSIEQNLKAITDETTALRAGSDALKSDMDARLKQAAKPADVKAALDPVVTRLAELETSVRTVLKSEQDRNATAGNILLSLELANLKRALDRGGKYAAELAAVNKLAGGKLDLAVLERQQNDGVPSLATLGGELAGIAHGMLDAEAEPADASIGERMLSGLKSVVRVRKIDPAPGDKSTEALIARMEAGLKEGRLGDVLEIAKTLPPKAVTPEASKWIARIEQRAQIDKALLDLDASLKTSLAGGAQPKKGTN